MSASPATRCVPDPCDICPVRAVDWQAGDQGAREIAARFENREVAFDVVATCWSDPALGPVRDPGRL